MNNVGQDEEQIMPIAFDNLEGNTGARWSCQGGEGRWQTQFPLPRGLAEKRSEKGWTLGAGGGSWSGRDLWLGKTKYMCGLGERRQERSVYRQEWG